MRTTIHVADAFIKQSFGPVTSVNIPARSTIKKIERSFFNSLVNLANLYQFEPLIITGKKYPFNIREAFNDAQKKLSQIASDTNLIILHEMGELPILATLKEFDTGLTLYYIPLDALWKLHKNRNKAAFLLLLSIYAYLYQYAGMSLCTEYHYVYDTYEMMKQSYTDNEDGQELDDFREAMQAFSLIERASPIFNREIRNTQNLYEFEYRLNSFEPRCDFETNLHGIATRFLALSKQYTAKKFAETNCSEFLYPGEEDRGFLDQYFAFCWNTDGWLMHQLIEWANCDLQEKTHFDLPYTVQKFDSRQYEPSHDFSFHDTLINLLNDLSDILNELS